MADLLTTNQVQDLLHVDRTTIYRMVEGGRLPAIRVGKQWRFSKLEIERWLRAQAAPSAPPPGDVEKTEPGKGSLQEIFPAGCAQSLQDAFADLLGVMIVVTDMAGRPLTQVSNPCKLYSAMIRDAEALSSCVAHWQQMAGLVSLEPKLALSEMGLLCARGLIRVGNELKGMVFFGGIAPEDWPPSEAEIAAIASHFGVDPKVITENLQAVYRLDKAARERVLSYTQRIADIFAHMLEDRITLYGRLQAIASLSAL